MDNCDEFEDMVCLQFKNGFSLAIKKVLQHKNRHRFSILIIFWKLQAFSGFEMIYESSEIENRNIWIILIVMYICLYFDYLFTVHISSRFPLGNFGI